MKRSNIKQYTKQLYDFYLNAKRMPSYSEMLKIFGLKSKNAVFKRISLLVKGGIIVKDKTGKLIPFTVQKPVKLLGSVKAGFPSPAEEETLDLMSLDEYLISSPDSTFLLKVEGDSMLDAGILPGDLVLIQRNLIPKNGDIVVACVDSQWTMKYFDKNQGRVSLRAANKKYPLIEPKQELTIAGVVIANVRKYK